MKIVTVLVDIVKGLTIATPAVAGCLSIFAKNSPADRTLYGDIKNGKGAEFMYDAREILTGVDADGRFRGDWFIGTYLPVVAGLTGSALVKGLWDVLG